MNKIIALCTIFAVLFGCVFCKVEDEESIKLHFYDGSSKWWIAVDPRDDSYETVKVEVREAADNQWTTMMHDKGWPYFHLPSTTGRGFALPLSFRFTSDNGEELETLVYRIGSNLLVDTKVQYEGVEPPTEVPTESPTTSPTEPSTPAPATQAPTESATPSPTEAATQAPTEPATVAPTEAATPAPTVPATVAPTEAATSAPTQPATPAPTVPATVAPTVPATPAPTQPATPAPTQAATSAPTQAATPAPTQAATPAPTQAATPAPTQAATPAPTQPATPAPTQPATPAPTQPARPPTAAPTTRPTTRPTEAATQPPTQPATPAPTQPATPAPTPKATPAPTQPATPAPTPKATPAPTQPATPAPTPKATPAPTQPATPAPTPKATPAPTQSSGDACALVSVKSEPLKILIPLYVYPGAAWDTIIAAAKTGVKIIAIINPNSGPNYNGPDASYTKYMKKFQDAGIEMVGYVHTSWGARSINTVNTEIGIYASKYPGVTGIFFDEAATEASQVPYYKTAYNTVLSKGFVHSILNPGTQPDQQYIDISSNIVIFENYASELSRAGYSSWVKCSPSVAKKSGYSYKFSAIIHTASQNDLKALIQRTYNLGMGLIYITDGPGGCCTYNYLNTYFTAQAAAVKAFNDS